MVYRLPSELFTVVCRPALPKDTAGALALTRRIWDGHDYVPYLWQEWLEDQHGMLAVAEYAGWVVGIVRMSSMGNDEWWLQGLRVDLDYQGKGIASRLHEYALAYWRRNCGGVLRLATSSVRLPVHHLCERTGFRRAGEFLAYKAPALDSPPNGFVPLVENQAAQLVSRVRSGELHKLSGGYINLGWVWGDLTAERLVEAVRRGGAHWWKSDEDADAGCLMVTGVDDDEEGDYLFMQLVGGSLSALTGMLFDARRLAGSYGYRKVVWVAPCQAEIETALRLAGFDVLWENTLYLYEKRSPE